MTIFTTPRAALVCLDLQRGREAAGAPARVEQCRRILSEVRRRRWPVLHVHDRGLSDARPIGGLEPRPDEPIFLRHGPSAFSNPRFGRAAMALGGPLALIGFALEDTVLATAFAAADRGLPVDVLLDAVCHDESAQPDRLAPLRTLTPRARLLAFNDLFDETCMSAANRP